MPIPASSFSFIFESVLVGTVVVAVLALFCIPLARRFNLVDIPNSMPHKHHLVATPLAGGLALFFALIFTSWLYRTYDDPNIAATFLAVVPIFVFGLWDDFKGISPLLKLIGQSLAVIILISLGVSIKVLESPEFFLGGNGEINIYLDWALTYLWVVGITNAYNFVDSMDGLAVGLGGMATAFFTLVTIDAGQLILSRHSALIMGACIGLFFFNSPPARLFLGDSGAQTLGFILAVLAVAYRPLGANQSSSWVVPIMLLGVPIFDMVLVVLSRLRKGKPVFRSALDHTFHRLVALGWNSNRAVLLMQIVSLILGCLAFLVLTRPPLIANMIFAATVLAGVLALVYLERAAG